MNENLSALLKKHGKNTRGLVQELFDQHSTNNNPEERKVMEKVILIAIEGEHEWMNVANLTEKWRNSEFRGSFIERMKRRVNQNDNGQPAINSK